jgi:hypothetical protein
MEPAAMMPGMTRSGFVVLSAGLMASLPLLYAASVLLLRGGADGADCAALGDGRMACALLALARYAAVPLLIVAASIGMGIAVSLRARSAQLSGLWGFLAMALTVQALTLIVSIVVGAGPDTAGPDPLAAALKSSALWLLVSFIVFLLLVPEWAGPRALDVGLSTVAGLAAIIVIAVGQVLTAAPSGVLPGLASWIAATVTVLPHIDWIALGVFVTALAGIMAGRVLPEAE